MTVPSDGGPIYFRQGGEGFVRFMFPVVSIAAIGLLVYTVLPWIGSALNWTAVHLGAGLLLGACCVGVPSCGWLLYQFRRTCMRGYACCEIGFAVAAAARAASEISCVDPKALQWVPVGAAAYLAVRGFVNLEEGNEAAARRARKVEIDAWRAEAAARAKCPRSQPR